MIVPLAAPITPSFGDVSEIAHAEFVVAGGAAGWVSTDISAAISGFARWSLWNVYASGNQDAGVREDGSSTDTKWTVGNGYHQTVGMCRVIGGKVELYREAANNAYYCIGYIR